MAKKIKITVAPKKTSQKVMSVSLHEQVKEAEKSEKERGKKVYNPRVRLTAHINKE